MPRLVLRALQETHLPSDRALALEAVQVGGTDVLKVAALSVKPFCASQLHSARAFLNSHSILLSTIYIWSKLPKASQADSQCACAREQAGVAALQSVGLDASDFLGQVVRVVPALQQDLLPS